MAESIWNNNYLLSNLDAQKLYAQSPLTTGVSGSSAYIGIEPSARYNETVLWSGDATSAITASESFKNFDRVKIYIKHETNPAYTFEFDFNNMGTTGYFTFCRPRGTANCNVAYVNCTATDTTLTNRYSKLLQFGSFTTTGTTITAALNNSEDLNTIYKVVGINRKEV